MPFITPDEISADWVSMTVCFPASFTHIVQGSILELTHAENWEQFYDSNLTVDECTALFLSVFYAIQMGSCSAP